MARVWILATLFLSVAVELPAKSLHWPRFDVTASLDSEGRLQIVERHEILFDGDWNGGERTFDLRAGQKLDLHAVRHAIVERAEGSIQKDHAGAAHVPLDRVSRGKTQ
ncbi:MAG: DUF2207 domain-containing protein [Acidobacteria bacterium]|nr:DUF2207 domain-containing protein [Acidobacteriota bacterium]